MALGFKEMSRNMDTVAMQGEKAAVEITNAFDGFGHDLISGNKSIEDAWTDLWDSMVDIFADAVSQMMKQQFIQPLINQISSGLNLTKIAGSLSPLNGNSASMQTGIGVSGLNAVQMTADGYMPMSEGFGSSLTKIGGLAGGYIFDGAGQNAVTMTADGYMPVASSGFSWTGLAQGGIGLVGSLLGTYLGGGTAEASIGSTIGGIGGGLAGGATLGASLGTWAGPVGMGVGALLGGIIGGLFGDDEPATPKMGVAFGSTVAENSVFHSDEYALAGRTLNARSNDLDAYALQSETVGYITTFLDKWTGAFETNVKSVFTAYPKQLGTKLKEGTDYTASILKQMVEQYGAAMVQGVLGVDFIKLLDPQKTLAGFSAKQVEAALMADGSAIRTSFNDFIASLAQSGESLSDTLLRVTAYLDFFPDVAARLSKIMAKEGTTLEGATRQLEGQVAWFIESIIPALNESMSAALANADFGQFEETFAANMGKILMDSVNAIGAKQLQDTFVTLFADSFLGLNDLMEGYAAGTTSLTGFNWGVQTLFKNFDSGSDKMTTAANAFSAIQTRFRKMVENMLGITEDRRTAFNADLTDKIKMAGMTDYQKAIYEINIWYKEQLTVAKEIGANIPLLTKWRDLQIQTAKEQYNNAKTTKTGIIGMFLEILDAIEGKMKDIKYSDLNVALPKQKAELASNDYAKLYTAALTGNQESIDAFLSFTTEYLQMQQDVYKSSTAYQQIYASTMADMAFLWKETRADLKTTRGYADGGIARGPVTGYSATLHGTEAIIPLRGGSVPVEITGGSNQRPLYITVQVGNEEFGAYVDQRADNIRVKAERRPTMKGRRAIL